MPTLVTVKITFCFRNDTSVDRDSAMTGVPKTFEMRLG